MESIFDTQSVNFFNNNANSYYFECQESSVTPAYSYISSQVSTSRSSLELCIYFLVRTIGYWTGFTYSLEFVNFILSAALPTEPFAWQRVIYSIA